METALLKSNNCVHETIKTTPFEISTNQKLISYLIVNKNNKNKLPKFQVRAFVRVPDKRIKYSKGSTTNWNKNLFKIHCMNNTSPVTDGLEDENKEIIQGKY